MLCKGVGGTLELLDDRLIIRRNSVLGVLIHGLAGEKTIPYSNIIAVQFKRRAMMVNGYIQFTIAGGNESVRGIKEAVRDENTLMFSDNETFEKARKLIEEKLGAGTGRQAQSESQSPVQDLEKLASLLDRGLLTKEEFLEQKSTLLGKSPRFPADQTELPPVDVGNVEKGESNPIHDRMVNALDILIEKHKSSKQHNSSASSTTTFGRRNRS